MSDVRRATAAGLAAGALLVAGGCDGTGTPDARTSPSRSVGPTATASVAPSPTASGGSALVAVPDVRRKTLPLAGTTLARAGLRWKAVTVATDRLPDGEVLDVTPVQGRRVKRGSTVTVREAITVVTVPDLVGQPVATAVAAVRRDRLEPDESGPVGSSAPAGARVTEQRPPAGERVREGTHVTLDYATSSPSPSASSSPSRSASPTPSKSAATGPPTTAPPTTAPPTTAPPDPGDTTVPAVVGDDEATAQDALDAAGLSAKLVTSESPDAPDGTVLRVVPGAGSRVGRGNTVTLYVAVSTTVVPDLTGLTADEADGQLAAIGLTPQHEPADADPDAVVTGQEPAAGQRLRQGGTVLLTVESASPGTPLPS